MHWIAIAAALLCGFCLPLGIGAAFDYRDNSDLQAKAHAGWWLGAAIIFGAAAIAIGAAS